MTDDGQGQDDARVIDNRIGPNFGKPIMHRECSQTIAAMKARLDALEAEVARLREAAQAYIDAYDAALKAPLQYAQAEEYCHTQRYNLRAALAARGGEG